MKRILSILFILTALLYSCSTDFDLVAPYKEIMVVDGLLNAFDSVQYIKVSKAFLGEGNAYVMAGQSDSTNYANILDVKMDRLVGKNVMETFDLVRTEQYNKDSGTFAYPFQVFYTTNHQLLQDGSEYKIRVTNTQTGTTASSQTKIVKDITVLSPLQLPPPAGDSIDLATGPSSPANIRFIPGANAVMFDVIVRFHYREIDPNGISTEHYIDWNQSDRTFTVTPAEVKYSFYKYDLFYVIGANIPDKPGYVRRVDSLSNNQRAYEYIITGGTEDLQTYYQLKQPTTGIVQEPPTFTTVTNGLGLFTSRIVHRLFYYPNHVTEAAFDTSVSTRTKNFKFD